MARLLATNPTQGETREFRIAKAEVTIGSASENNIVLRHPSVSRRHAVIRSRRRRFELLDLKSTNGTYVNERRIQDATVLSDGDRIGFGAAAFLFSAPEAARNPTRSLWGGLARAFALALIFLVSVFGLVGYLGDREFLTEKARELSGLVVAEWVAPETNDTTRVGKPGVVPVANLLSKPSAAAAAASPRSSPTPEVAISPTPDWLATINYYRAMAGLPATVEDRALSESDSKHARYLMVNYGDAIRDNHGLGDDEQEERPDKPGYSADGAAAAINSEMAYGCGSFSAADEIVRFMTDAFHRLAFLSPDLDRAALGSYADHACWAAAVRIPVPASNPKVFDHPVEFPPDGATTALQWMSGEWPEPLAACPGYDPPAGLPISLELGRMIPAQLSAHSITENGRAIEHCAFDNATFTHPNADAQEYARRSLREFGAVVLIPREPLHAGATFAVSVTARGQTYSWSFKTATGAR